MLPCFFWPKDASSTARQSCHKSARKLGLSTGSVQGAFLFRQRLNATQGIPLVSLSTQAAEMFTHLCRRVAIRRRLYAVIKVQTGSEPNELKAK